jgi:hypothetical protein
MPKRVIDFDAMWGSDKLAACAAWAQAEYAWLYGLADASGCFELTNLRVIWGRVAAIRANLTIERLEQVFAEFQEKGLLFVWEHEGKRYAHWTGSDVPGRLPPPSWRMRLEKFAPPVPKQRLAEYMAKFARGRAALAGVGFSGEATHEPANGKEDLKFEISNLREEQPGGRCGPSSQGRGQRTADAGSRADCEFENSRCRESGRSAGPAQDRQMTDERLLVTQGGEDGRFETSNLREARPPGAGDGNSYLRARQAPAEVAARDARTPDAQNAAAGCGLKGRLEGAPAQDLGLDWDLEGNLEVGRDGKREGAGDSRGRSGVSQREKELSRNDSVHSNSSSNSNSHLSSNSHARTDGHFYSNGNFDSRAYAQGMSAKEIATLRELRVGQGPVCGPCGVRQEVLERDRRRQAARLGTACREGK